MSGKGLRGRPSDTAGIHGSLPAERSAITRIIILTITTIILTIIILTIIIIMIVTILFLLLLIIIINIFICGYYCYYYYNYHYYHHYDYDYGYYYYYYYYYYYLLPAQSDRSPNELLVSAKRPASQADSQPTNRRTDEPRSYYSYYS